MEDETYGSCKFEYVGLSYFRPFWISYELLNTASGSI